MDNQGIDVEHDYPQEMYALGLQDVVYNIYVEYGLQYMQNQMQT